MAMSRNQLPRPELRPDAANRPAGAANAPKGAAAPFNMAAAPPTGAAAFNTISATPGVAADWASCCAVMSGASTAWEAIRAGLPAGLPSGQKTYPRFEQLDHLCGDECRCCCSEDPKFWAWGACFLEFKGVVDWKGGGPRWRNPDCCTIACGVDPADSLLHTDTGVEGNRIEWEVGCALEHAPTVMSALYTCAVASGAAGPAQREAIGSLTRQLKMLIGSPHYDGPAARVAELLGGGPFELRGLRCVRAEGPCGRGRCASCRSDIAWGVTGGVTPDMGWALLVTGRVHFETVRQLMFCISILLLDAATQRSLACMESGARWAVLGAVFEGAGGGDPAEPPALRTEDALKARAVSWALWSPTEWVTLARLVFGPHLDSADGLIREVDGAGTWGAYIRFILALALRGGDAHAELARALGAGGGTVTGCLADMRRAYEEAMLHEREAVSAEEGSDGDY